MVGGTGPTGRVNENGRIKIFGVTTRCFPKVIYIFQTNLLLVGSFLWLTSYAEEDELTDTYDRSHCRAHGKRIHAHTERYTARIYNKSHQYNAVVNVNDRPLKRVLFLMIRRVAAKRWAQFPSLTRLELRAA